MHISRIIFVTLGATCFVSCMTNIAPWLGNQLKISALNDSHNDAVCPLGPYQDNTCLPKDGYWLSADDVDNVPPNQNQLEGMKKEGQDDQDQMLKEIARRYLGNIVTWRRYFRLQFGPQFNFCQLDESGRNKLVDAEWAKKVTADTKGERISINTVFQKDVLTKAEARFKAQAESLPLGSVKLADLMADFSAGLSTELKKSEKARAQLLPMKIVTSPVSLRLSIDGFYSRNEFLKGPNDGCVSVARRDSSSVVYGVFGYVLTDLEANLVVVSHNEINSAIDAAVAASPSLPDETKTKLRGLKGDATVSWSSTINTSLTAGFDRKIAGYKFFPRFYKFWDLRDE